MARKALLLSLVTVALLYFINARLAYSIKEFALSRAQLEGVNAINKAVCDMVTAEVCYQDLVVVRQDESGQVVLVQPNPIKISQVVAMTQLAVKDALLDLSEQQFSVPLGQVLGSSVVSALGPRVPVRIIPVGMVNVNLKDKFEQAGINQTRHLVVLDINTTVKVAVPFYSESLRVSTSMPLVETIIVGKVPDTYLNFQGRAKILESEP